MTRSVHITLFFVALVIIFPASRLLATETYICASSDDFGLMFHFGSGGFSDLAVFESRDRFQAYGGSDFTTFVIKEPSPNETLNSYRIKLVRTKSSDSLPALTVEINGTAGYVIFKKKRYNVKCDWDD